MHCLWHATFHTGRELKKKVIWGCNTNNSITCNILFMILITFVFKEDRGEKSWKNWREDKSYSQNSWQQVMHLKLYSHPLEAFNLYQLWILTHSRLSTGNQWILTHSGLSTGNLYQLWILTHSRLSTGNQWILTHSGLSIGNLYQLWILTHSGLSTGNQWILIHSGLSTENQWILTHSGLSIGNLYQLWILIHSGLSTGNLCKLWILRRGDLNFCLHRTHYSNFPTLPVGTIHTLFWINNKLIQNDKTALSLCPKSLCMTLKFEEEQHPLSLVPCWDGKQHGSMLFPWWQRFVACQSLWRRCMEECWFCTGGRQHAGSGCSSSYHFQLLPPALSEPQGNGKHTGNMYQSGILSLSIIALYAIRTTGK